MDLRTLPRTAFTTYLKVLRFPLDRAARLAGGRTAAAVESADAAAHDTVGKLTGDKELRAKGRKKSAAAKERKRATELRAQAAKRRASAEKQAVEREAQADEQRETATASEKRKREDAEKRRKQTTARAVKTADVRKAESRKAEAKADALNEQQEERDRLVAVEVRQDAVNERDAALTSADEADRLRKAAGRAKAQRKKD